MGLFGKLKNGLLKTRQKLGSQLKNIISSHSKIDEELYDELEETLISADVGIDATFEILEVLRKKVKVASADGSNPDIIHGLLTETISEILNPTAAETSLDINHQPAVILIVGVNGSGKTTSIAKLAHHFLKGNKKVMLAAADTFRAAATEQLQEWGRRLNVTVVHQQTGADPAAVAFDALQSAIAKEYDILIIDTAGRLHNKTNLMQELAKITRVLKKQDPDAPHEVFLVLDGTTGQNALQQAKVFQEISGVTGLIMSKLDGTAKGGAVIPICRELDLPLRFIGLGEKVEDLEVFDPGEYARAILEPDEEEV